MNELKAEGAVDPPPLEPVLQQPEPNKIADRSNQADDLDHGLERESELETYLNDQHQQWDESLHDPEYQPQGESFAGTGMAEPKRSSPAGADQVVQQWANPTGTAETNPTGTAETNSTDVARDAKEQIVSQRVVDQSGSGGSASGFRSDVGVEGRGNEAVVRKSEDTTVSEAQGDPSSPPLEAQRGRVFVERSNQVEPGAERSNAPDDSVARPVDVGVEQVVRGAGDERAGDNLADVPRVLQVDDRDDSDRLDRGDGRDTGGRFTGLIGTSGYGKIAEEQGLREMQEAMDYGELIDAQVVARLPDESKRSGSAERKYDGLVSLPDGTYLGFEIKTGSTPYDANQRTFDARVAGGELAKAQLDGRLIEIRAVIVHRVYPPGPQLPRSV